MQTPTIPAWVVGFLRYLGAIVLFAVLSALTNAAALTPFFGATSAGLIVVVVGALEHAYDQKNGTALFGAIRTR